MSRPNDAKNKRMQVMLENAAMYSDVEFHVGSEGESFFGLKAIYARASEVFSKMFFEGGFREQHEVTPRVVVEITDIAPASFQQLHRWVYDMDVTLVSDTVFGVLDAARKYMVEDLELTCRRWIAAEARTAEGAISLFTAAVTGKWQVWSQGLLARVESFGAAGLLSAPQAYRMLPKEAFISLLGSEDFAVTREEDVFLAAQAWCAAAADRGEDSTTAWEGIQQAKVIHFNLLEPRFFAEQVVVPGLLSQEKSLEVFVARDLGSGSSRTASLMARLQLILRDAVAEDAASFIEPLIEFRHEADYPRVLAHCLVQKALADHEHISEWASIWIELWGALRAAGLRDECVRATVDYCQNLFEEDPPSEGLVGVWTCPSDTLGLVRVLCKLNEFRKLAVLPLVKVLEALVRKAEDSAPQGGAACDPIAAARELAPHLEKVRARHGHMAALHSLTNLQQRLESAAAQL
eukprot:TRINITY_DN31288_c0_g2_i1.p1 TRINITY_DN31288_c0_g2~~TRINITY_DN31288_c0_g2_i1.p1  ORF type:complete len:463 (-),score=93.72 TRINITY_DN31288_c0_g2_i1:60-1448(-)